MGGLKAAQKTIIIILDSTSGVTWIVSALEQENMMTAMSPTGIVNPLSVLLFTVIWTAGMAAMMFPAISPMVLLYNRLAASGRGNGGGQNRSTAVFAQDDKHTAKFYPVKTLLFVASYLIVWALTGIGLLIGWSLIANSISGATISQTNQSLNIAYGSISIISGAYQFSPLKSKCLGYCESPMSFFMRRWKGGASGALKMGIFHGIYCLGCCWPYFLLMVALGWMNLLWMGLFSGIIFAEKMWRNGIWIARIAGIGLAVVGVLMLSGYLPSIVSSGHNYNNNNDMAMEVNTGHNQEGTGVNRMMPQVNNGPSNSESSSISSDPSQVRPNNSDGTNNPMSEMN